MRKKTFTESRMELTDRHSQGSNR